MSMRPREYPTDSVQFLGGQPRKHLGMTAAVLRTENEAFRGTGGLSASNRSRGFLPAFRDNDTGMVFLSRFTDGRPAPMHLLGGLPAHLVVTRTNSGRVSAVKASVSAGFLRGGRFYTREEAARAVEQECDLAWSMTSTKWA